MKLTLSDYIIGILYVLPTIGACIAGATLFTKFDFNTVVYLTTVITIVDYSWHIRVTKSEKTIDDLKNKVKQLEEKFLESKCYYYPKWFMTFLKGYRFNSKEVHVEQDEEGHLEIKIKGLLWRTVFWEQPILAIVSELYHLTKGEMNDYDLDREFQKSYNKARMLLEAGVTFSEFGTRRRFSFDHQEMVIASFVKAVYEQKHATGKLAGTSNVYFAFKYNLTPIGTMAHQYISMIGAFYGPTEANNIAMNIWEEVYNGSLGVFLYDTYTRDVFLNNFSEKNAKLFDGLRVDSGDNMVAFNALMKKYNSLKIDPASKSITFSNALDTLGAIELHKRVDGRMKDSYGIGTHFTCDIDNVKPSNMVIKLTRVRITENREWLNCIKLSDDLGKYTGDSETVKMYKQILNLA